MPIASITKVSSHVIDMTRGWGNTRDSLTVTLDRIRDNDICDQALVKSLNTVLQARWNSEIVDVDEVAPITPEEMNDGLLAVYRWWVNACPCRDSGHHKFFATLSGILCTGPMIERCPAIQGWVGFQMEEWDKRWKRR